MRIRMLVDAIKSAPIGLTHVSLSRQDKDCHYWIELEDDDLQDVFQYGKEYIVQFSPVFEPGANKEPLDHTLDMRYALDVAKNIPGTVGKTDAELSDDPFVLWLASVFNKRAEEAILWKKP